jgi:hypothetical protein
MATDVAEPVVPEVAQLSSPLRDIVAQMVAMRDQLEAEETEMFAAAHAKRAEREQIDRMIRASQPKAKAEAKLSRRKSGGEAALLEPCAMPTNERSVAAITKCINVIEAFDGKEFQIGMVAKRTGSNRRIVSVAIGVMRGEDRIRILGKRKALERSPGASGGAPAVTFKEVK